jgi:ABC-type multidrug transport system fused ATPase/permease subunit
MVVGHPGLASDRPPGERATFRVMYDNVRRCRLSLVSGGLLSLATSATTLVLPLVVRALINDLSRHRGLSGLIVIMCVLMLAEAVLGAAGSYVLLRAADSVVLDTRKSLTSRLLRITIGSLDASEPGDLIARATVDTTLLRNVISSAVVPAVTGTLTALAVFVVMGLVDAALLGVTLIAIVGNVVVQGVVMPRIGRATGQAQEAVGAMTAALERTFGAFRTLKASCAEAREEARVHAAAVQAWRAGLGADLWQAVVGNTTTLAVQFALLAVLAVGAAQAASGAISIGTMVAFLMYVVFLIGPVNQLVNAASLYQIGAAAVTRIEEAKLLPAESAEPADALVFGDGPARVEFANVQFRYCDGHPEACHGMSFAIPSGGMTAFVGPSGAGKTTVFSLIERFYEPDSGSVLIDGTEIRQWPLSALRAAIGYVEQDAPVLSGTLRENLMFGAPGATSEELDGVLRLTRLFDLAARLPDGLETCVGHRGMRLSGGERQRVAIARALLRRPRLLLLDEATSQLDAINEAALRETIADVARLITVLVVAHRLSTVTMAGQIIVMDNGRIQATGTHAELIAASPLYAELAATQFLAAERV